MILTEEIDAMMQGVGNMNTPPSIMNRVVNNILANMSAPHSDQVCFRASSIGKPWILQVLGRWYPSEPVFSVSQCMKMLDGIVAQGWAEEILTLAGFDYESETEMRLELGNGVEVVGHSDIIVRNVSTRQITVVECKSMAGHVISKFFKSPHDEYGYLSQLAFYTSMVRRLNPTFTVEPMFLLFDRNQGCFKSVVITDDVIKAKFSRVESALVDVANIPIFNIDALLDTVMIPPPINGQVPGSMKWTKWAKCFYFDSTEGVQLYDKATSKRLIENMTQNKIGSL